MDLREDSIHRPRTSEVAIGRRPGLLLVTIVLAVVAFVTEWSIIYAGHRSLPIVVLFHVASVAFVAVIGIHILVVIVRSTTVTADTVLGGVCAYLLLGVAFVFLFSLTEVLAPGSFDVPESLGDARAVMTWVPFHTPDSATPDAISGESHLRYFSFTTMTTLGYGDITPRGPVARSLAMAETVLGQLYLAILIARLVASAMPRFMQPAGTGTSSAADG